MIKRLTPEDSLVHRAAVVLAAGVEALRQCLDRRAHLVPRLLLHTEAHRVIQRRREGASRARRLAPLGGQSCHRR
eukprot:COSAG02_NODE_2259_length_9330_cov_25.813455_4_plen_75_part_00